jgi:hypothetical protein
VMRVVLHRQLSVATSHSGAGHRLVGGGHAPRRFVSPTNSGHHCNVDRPTGNHQIGADICTGLDPDFAAYVSWAGLRARMVTRTDEGRDAGVWGIDELASPPGSD